MLRQRPSQVDSPQGWMGTWLGCLWECGQMGVQKVNIAPHSGMYPVGYHVCEREEGAAHGPEPLLWG